MAYDKIIVIDRRLDHCLDYALNEEKTALSRTLDYGMEPTKTRRLVTGVNCCPETACSEMQATKRRWDKQGGIQGYHIIHSYAPGEVTPEEAHEAGVEFARRLLGDRYEAVVSTHTDQEHLHCHIVFNSVSFMDGKKYRSDFRVILAPCGRPPTPSAANTACLSLSRRTAENTTPSGRRRKRAEAPSPALCGRTLTPPSGRALPLNRS